MRKNGSRLISVKQYRATDLFIFAVIITVAEILTYFAGKWFPGGAYYTFSLMLPITLTVMMRWGWPSVLYAIWCGLLTCLLGLDGGEVEGAQFASYIIGNGFIGIALLVLHFIGKDNVRSHWWSTVLFAMLGWLLVYLGRSSVWAVAYQISPISGLKAYAGFEVFAVGDMLSLLMAIVVVLVLRKLDGMFEDQKGFLRRLDKERREKIRRDEFGDEAIEIDEETLSILNRDNDLYD